jgi:predicted O-methyltransferase YrrM
MGFGLGLKSKAYQIKSELGYLLHNVLLKPNLYDTSSDERIGVVYHQPSDMCFTDRIMLYALVRGLRPQRALEIGVRWGGSAKIMTSAMEENGIGKLVGLDPFPEAFRAKSKELHRRYTLVRGYSPDGTDLAVKELDGPLDFVLIDALHTHDAVVADFQGVIPYLDEKAHVLLHDTYHQGINEGINKILSAHPDFIDCGFLTRNPSVGTPVSYQGLRLIRKGTVDGLELITEAYQRAEVAVPPFSASLWNYDEYANRINQGATQVPDCTEDSHTSQ